VKTEALSFSETSVQNHTASHLGGPQSIYYVATGQLLVKSMIVTDKNPPRLHIGLCLVRGSVRFSEVCTGN
jgi:hypothetical protein